MDYFLNFKNKKYESLYYDSIDPYLAKIIKSNLVILIVVVPFLPYTQSLRFRNPNISTSQSIQRTLTTCILYCLLALLVLFIIKTRSSLKKHHKITRWSFDLFFNLIAGYYAFQFWENNKDGDDAIFQYFVGWWQSTIAFALLSPLSRWYLKLGAYLTFILRIGVGAYLSTHSTVILIRMIQILLLKVLLTYLNERDDRKFFLEKQFLYEETKVYKDIFDLTSDGVIIYGLKEGLLFRNGSHQNYRWWQEDQSLEQNFAQVQLKSYKKTNHMPSNVDLDLDSLIHSPTPTNFWKFYQHLMEQLSLKLVNPNSSESLKPGKLMLLTGVVERDSSDPLAANNNYLIEIKIMFTYFQEKPSLAIILSDITERSLVTVLQENNNYKNRLLASVSHELRTPLNASINFTQAAIEHPDLSNHPEIRDNYLMPALRSNELLLHLINDILDFSQMSANKLRLVYESKDVGVTLDECVNLVNIQANRKGIKVFTDYKFEAEKREFHTDHNRLKQIMLNLLSNALKFTLEGEIRVSAKLSTDVKKQEIEGEERITIGQTEPDTRLPVARGRKGRRILSISVSDTGIGISEENKRKLFKAFEKIELGDRIALNTQGVGLGLVISNNLVLMLGPPEQNNGMKVESTETKGTTFSFWIVEQSCSEEVSESSVKSEDMCSRMEEHPHSYDYDRLETVSHLVPIKTMDTLTFNNRNRTVQLMTDLPRNIETTELITLKTPPQILIVDDEIFNIAALQMILHKLGYTCDAAYNGKQAIQKILQRQSESKHLGMSSQYKLIFMDWNMPVMNGLETIKDLKKRMDSGEIDEITMIACSAFLNEKEKALASEFGVEACCIKPLNKDIISDHIKKYLSQKNLQTRL